MSAIVSVCPYYCSFSSYVLFSFLISFSLIFMSSIVSVFPSYCSFFCNFCSLSYLFLPICRFSLVFYHRLVLFSTSSFAMFVSSSFSLVFKVFFYRVVFLSNLSSAFFVMFCSMSCSLVFQSLFCHVLFLFKLSSVSVFCHDLFIVFPFSCFPVFRRFFLFFVFVSQGNFVYVLNNRL